MRTRDWKHLVRAVAPDESDWAFRQNLCYSTPVGHVLFGVDMGTARDPDQLFIVRIALPLFVPTLHVHGGERQRGSGGDSVSLTKDDVGAVVRSVLSSGYDERDELAKMVARGQDPRPMMLVETGGYAQFLLGDSSSALRMLQDGLEFDRSLPEDSRPFVVELRGRMRLICAMLQSHDDDAVRAQLNRWRAQTVSNLGLAGAK